MRWEWSVLPFLLFLVPFKSDARWISLKDGPKELMVSYNFNSSNQLNVSISLSGVEVERVKNGGDEYLKISIPKAGVLTEVGKPELPIFTSFLALPPHKEIHIDIEGVDTQELMGTYMIYPHQNPPIRSPNPDAYENTFEIDEKTYREDRIFPQKIVELRDPVTFREIRIVPLIIYPVRYNPKRGKVTVVRDLKLRITYDNASIYDREKFPLRLTTSFMPLYKTFVKNFDQFYSGIDVQDGTYLVIVKDEYYDAVKTLVDWRRLEGANVKVVRLSEISGAPTFDDLRAYIEDAYHNWESPPEYLLLFGDYEDIPSGSGVSGFASDNGYATVSGDDYLPDIHVARIPVNSVESAYYVVNKILKYDREPTIDNSNWYKKVLTISRSDYVDDANARRCGELALQYGGFIKMDSLWKSLGTNSLYLLKDAINEGRSFVAYFDHGSETSWLALEPVFKIGDVQGLNNVGKLPVIVDIACLNSKFDYQGGDCLSEAWIKAGEPGHEIGAIAVLGATSTSPFVYTDTLGRGFFKGYFEDSLWRLGDAVDYAKLYLYQNFPEPSGGLTQATIEMHEAFGDPYMMFWTDVPRSLLVSHPSKIPLGLNTVEVLVRGEKGEPIQGAIVTISQRGKLIGKRKTDMGGKATLEVEIIKEDSIALVVSGHNLIPYTGYILPKAEGVYLTVGKVIIDDSKGNGDGKVNPGEEIFLNIYVKNLGATKAKVVEGLLSSSSDCVHLLVDSVRFGDIEPGDSTLSDGAFYLSVQKDCYLEDTLSFNLELKDTFGNQWTSHFNVSLCFPIVEIDSILVIDSVAQEPDGFPEPGELVDLKPLLKTHGCYEVNNLTLILSTNSPYVEIIDGVSRFHRLVDRDSSQILGDAFKVKILEEAPFGASIPFEIKVKGEGVDSAFSVTMNVAKGGDYLIWDPDRSHISGPEIKEFLDSLGYSGYYLGDRNLGEFRPILHNFKSLFVCLGAGNEKFILSKNNADAWAVVSYLSNGGKIYLEGADPWYYDPRYEDGLLLDTLFGINATSDGSGDLSNIHGVQGTFTEGLTFSYSGTNKWIDRLLPMEENSWAILKNNSPSYFCGIAHVDVDLKTVGLSCSFGGLTGTIDSKRALLDSIMHFFGIYRNHPPSSFSLRNPPDGDTLSLPFYLEWKEATDPDPEDEVSYDLYLSVYPDFPMNRTIKVAGLSKNRFLVDSSFLDTLTGQLRGVRLGFIKGSMEGLHKGLSGGKLSEANGFGSVLENMGISVYYWKVKARDGEGGDRWSNETRSFAVVFCKPGDANGDGNVDMNDITFLGNYIYLNGPKPTPCSDLNGNGRIESGDLLLLGNYLYGQVGGREGKGNIGRWEKY